MADVVLYRNPDGQVVRLTSDSFNVTYEDSFIDITIDAPRSTDQVGLWYEVNTSDFYQPLNYSLRLNLDSNQITTVTLQSATASSYQNALDGAWETINKTFNLRIYRPTNPVITLADSDFVEDIIVDSDNILYSEEIEITGNESEIQELLVSGVNIKTINAQSLLGSGNLVISGGGGGSGVGTLDSLSDVNITGITENQLIKFNSVSETFEPISIKTINNNSLLGSGDISITADLSNISFSTIINTPTTIAGYGITDAFDGQYSSLSGAPTNVSSFTNDAGYITSLTTLSFTNITDKPTTISGYGITDAFNGQYSSLSGIPSTFTPSAHNQDWTTITGIPSTFPPSSHTQAFSTITSTPTTIAGYGITDAFDGQYSSLSGIPSTFTPSTHNHDWNTITDTPTTIDSYGITDAFDGAFSSLTGTPTTISGYGITDALSSGTTIRDLSDIYDTDPADGQVLKWDSDNNRWSPSPDIATVGAVGFSADLLDSQEGTYYLDYNNFTNTPTIPTNTSQISEGSNLYYTDTRVDSRVLNTLLIDEDDMSSNSATKLPSQQSVKAYVDNEVAAVVDAAPEQLNTLNELAAAINDDSNFAVNITTLVGTKLSISDFNTTFDNRLATKSTSNLSEGSNLYYTTSRSDSDFDVRLNTKSTDDLSEGSNLYYTDARFDTRFGTKSTSDISEGSNLYYTDARFDSRLATKSTDDVTEGSNLYYTDARFDTRFNTKTTSNLSEGSNLYYTTDRVDSDFNISFAAKTADSLSEGLINFYYTDAKVDARIGLSVLSDLSNVASNVASANEYLKYNGSLYVPSPIEFQYLTGTPTTISGYGITDAFDGQYSSLTGIPTEFTADLSNKTTDDLSEGSTNLYYTNARADARINLQTGVNLDLSSKTTSDLTEGTNLYYTQSRFNTAFTSKSTSDLSEGTNLYFTNARADARINNALAGDITIGGNLTVSGTSTTINTQTLNVGDNIIVLNADETGSPTQNAGIEVERGTATNVVLRYNESINKWQFTNDGSNYSDLGSLVGTTDDVTEGSTNLYYTNSRFDTRLGTKTTDDVTEGSTNLYYTDARVDARINLQTGTNIDLSSKSTDDLSEGSTNLYYTDTRVDSRFSTKSTDDLSEGSTNLYYTDTRFDSRFNLKSTTNLSEGTNLYYTDGRADARINLQTGTNLDLSNKSTSDLSEGTNLYYTDARVQTKLGNVSGHILPSADQTYDLGSSNYRFRELWLSGSTIRLGTLRLKDSSGSFVVVSGGVSQTVVTENTLNNLVTDDVTEGSTNLYYTQSRFDTAFTAKSTSDLSEGTNLYYTDTRFDTRLATKSTDDVTEGSNLYYTDARADARINNTLSGDVVIGGNLTVSGTTTQVNSNTVNIGDNILVLNADETGAPSQNAGIEIQRGTSANVVFRYNEGTDKWEFTNDGSTFTDLGTEVLDDTSPQLGGTLDANGNDIDMGVNTITDTKVGQWDTAYGWGDHASAGYLTDISSQNLTTLTDVDAVISSDDGKILFYDHGTTSFKWKDEATSGVTAFTSLTDGPGAYTNNSGKYVKVNSAQNGLEYTELTTDVTAIVDTAYVNARVTRQSFDFGSIVTPAAFTLDLGSIV